MDKLWRFVIPLSALIVMGVGLMKSPLAESSSGVRQVANLQLNDEVIQNRIARKQAKLDGTFKRPEHPDGYADFRDLLRSHPEGTNIMELQLEALNHTKSMPVLDVDKDAGLWGWDWLGPGNIGGRVRAILIHPTQPNILWAGSASGGIWKTTNGGNSWFPLQDFLGTLAISAMVMDPNDPDILYAATGEGLAGRSAPGLGIFKSEDGGVSWNHLSGSYDVRQDAYYINDLIIHPYDSNILYAAVARRGRNTGIGHIWRSQDAGVTWGSVLETPTPAMDLGIDPDNPNIVMMSYYNGVYRSTQAGDINTWVELSTGQTFKLPDDTGRTTFAFGVGNDVVYASCDVPIAVGAAQGEIWRSLDNGELWELRRETHHLKTQGHYDNVIWLMEGSTDYIMFGGIDLYKSTDGGINYYNMSDWRDYHSGTSAHADQHVIVAEPGFTGLGTIYFGNDGGVQKNTVGFGAMPNYGWVNLANNLGITQFYHADASPDGSVMLGGTQDNDDLRFTRSSGAQNWYQAETGDGTYCFIDPTDTDIMYGSYPWLQIEKTYDGGNIYLDHFNGLGDAGDGDRALFIAPFALDKVAPYNLIAGGESIWRSSNGAVSWHQVLGPRAGWPLCSSVEISPTAGTTVCWVGYTDGSIWKTEDQTLSWTEVEPTNGGDLWDDIILEIEISPHNPDLSVVVLSGYYQDRIWMSFNNGGTFVNRSGTGATALPVIQVNTIAFHPNNPDWIYAGTDVGMYASEDLGLTWSVTPASYSNEGPSNVEINDLIWHSGDTLVAVTYGRGFYECRPLETVYVDIVNSGPEDGTIFSPYNTFGEGYGFIGNGSTLIVGDGEYVEDNLVMKKRIKLQGMGGPVIIK